MNTSGPLTRSAEFRALPAPASARELHAGPDGLEVLAFGTHSPGDGEMVNGTDDR